MGERVRRLRWVFLLVAAALVVVFLVAQRQGALDVSYGQAPAVSEKVTEDDPGVRPDIDLPPVARLTDMLDADPVVRLPGSVAQWDEQRVRDAIGDADIRVLVTPPGLSEEQRETLRDVDNATIVVTGTKVSGTLFEVVPDDVETWRASLATGEVTGLLLTMIAAEKDAPDPPEVTVFSWRDPTPAELDTVAADLRRDGLHVADGATLDRLPAAADAAFDGQRPLVAAFPRQPAGQPVPDYGPALAALFPDRPVLVMYGNWVAYHGPHAAEFADLVGAGFFARYGALLSRADYPQRNVLGVYLGEITDVRYAGLFDRPLPYRPFDPLRVALPALPWLFCLCVLAFLALSVRSVLGPRGAGAPSRPPARLAALTALAIELSGLSHAPALTRALGKLAAARSALADTLPDRDVSRLLTDAQHDLDSVARELGRPEYRPVNYLVGGPA